MTYTINQRISAIIAQVTQEQIAHLLQAGTGRYKQYIESAPEEIDGYKFTWAVDEFLGAQGVGCIFRFYAAKDGERWLLMDGHGPGYVEGTEEGWKEIQSDTNE